VFRDSLSLFTTFNFWVCAVDVGSELFAFELLYLPLGFY
jgi:hypothetical protein